MRLMSCKPKDPFGLEGDTLITGVVASDATRKTAVDIEAHLKTLMPAL